LINALFDPPILFFALGLISVAVRSDVQIPPSISKFIALYLLMAIGFKGGVSLAETGLTSDAVRSLSAAIGCAFVIPFLSFFVLRLRLSSANAAAIAAAYGSVSAITFITALSWLENRAVPSGGHMIAALALMESPAIIVSVFLLRWSRRQHSLKSETAPPPTPWGQLLHDAFLNGSVYMLLGSLLVGVLCGPQGAKDLQPLIVGLFKGFLCFFLLDLGIIAARQLRHLKEDLLFLVSFALIAPFCQSLVGLAAAWSFGLSPGDGFLLVVLTASASYIAVPAAMRLCIPEAEPALYLSMALGLTFPLNIMVGLPIYWAAVNLVL
jgi:hypothetical protein